MVAIGVCRFFEAKDLFLQKSFASFCKFLLYMDVNIFTFYFFIFYTIYRMISSSVR